MCYLQGEFQNTQICQNNRKAPTLSGVQKGRREMDKKTYRKAQFEKVATEYNEYKPKIKIIKPNGETNWLDISEEELRKIKEILTA
jgi:hypothetical protein